VAYSPGGVDWAAVQVALFNFVTTGVSGSPVAVTWSQQDAPRPASPAIEMRISNITELGRAWEDTANNPLSFTAKTVSAVNTSLSQVTVTANGLGNGDGPFQLTSTGTVPAGLSPLTNYWAIVVDANTLQFADTFVHTGGQQPLGVGNPVTPLTITGVGSGTISLNSTTDSLSAGSELLGIARTMLRITLELSCHTIAGVGIDMATSILQRIRNRAAWHALRDPLQAANVGFLGCERVRAIAGVRDAVLFEPRSILEIYFSVPCEEIEDITIISTADVQETVDA
jgi:hypothetical protein